jgi:hypothetical protein
MELRANTLGVIASKPLLGTEHLKLVAAEADQKSVNRAVRFPLDQVGRMKSGIPH